MVNLPVMGLSTFQSILTSCEIMSIKYSCLRCIISASDVRWMRRSSRARLSPMSCIDPDMNTTLPSVSNVGPQRICTQQDARASGSSGSDPGLLAVCSTRTSVSISPMIPSVHSLMYLSRSSGCILYCHSLGSFPRSGPIIRVVAWFE
jgi:hypothetical protein